jgi:CHAT domain-containing protein
MEAAPRRGVGHRLCRAEEGPPRGALDGGAPGGLRRPALSRAREAGQGRDRSRPARGDPQLHPDAAALHAPGVTRIARLFPGRARTYLGDEATEAHAKALDRDARYVHFACHGTLDERFPLNSALALSIPEAPAAGGDNGLLQAWEIFDKVRIDAELVTLSACDTALGKEMGGEGLLGLTRAFHYAGARSVLATLWGVSDTSTPRLMERFYTHLQAGKSRDEALRAAQLDFIRGGGDAAHPFRWAALQLSGDWR